MTNEIDERSEPRDSRRRTGWWLPGRRGSYSLAAVACVALAHSLAPRGAVAQLDETCTVSALNRSARVAADGSWVLPNVPANFGPVRVRATCVDDGATRSGQSDFVTLPANGVVAVPDIAFDAPAPVPARLALTAPSPVLTFAGQTLQLSATVTYPDGSTADVTPAAAGTSYTISNPAIATLDGLGRVTAVASGTVVVSATHEGALGVLALRVNLGGDSDGDGLPDDFELANGMDPNDPADALRDHDEDGLATLDEFLAGLDPFDSDVDGDGLLDGAEVNVFGTDPVRFDTDGDGLSDGLEVATGSDPLDPASYNLAAALASLEVRPAAFGLIFNTVVGEGSRQLVVLGHLLDGTTIDLASTSRGTTYQSSNLAVCNFGAPDGRVYAGANGACTVTVANGGHSGQAFITVNSFAPIARSFVDLPGYGNNVDVAGDFAYVAAGAAGLAVVDVSDRGAPVVVATADTPGNANDVRVQGSLAYVADGAAGLAIFDVGNPLAPALLGQVDTPGIAQDVAVKGPFAYVADGAAGLSIVDLTDPAAPVRVGALGSLVNASGVDVAAEAPLAAVAVGAAGIRIVEVANPAAPLLRGGVDTVNARDVAVGGRFAFVADDQGSFVAVEFTNPAAPVIRGSTPPSLGGFLRDVALAGPLAFGADIFFVNGVPIVGVEPPATPTVRAILDFAAFRDDNGTGVAVDGRFVYLTASRTGEENGASGLSRLYIGQYLDFGDEGQVAPTVALTAPAPGAQVLEGTPLLVRAAASDDVAVAAVTFEVDGQVVATDATAPFDATVTVPSGVASLTLGATAFDLAGNSGTAEPVVVSVVPDPLTMVTGVVVDLEGAPLAGATATTLGGRSATTDAAGLFFIPEVPTALGDVPLVVEATLDGEPRTVRPQPLPPVPGGVTDFGTIVVAPCLLPPAGMTSWWPFDETTGTVAADLVAGNNGALVNGPLHVPGFVEGGLSFDGVNDHFRAADHDLLDVGDGDFSFDAWIRTTQLGLPILLDKRNRATTGAPIFGYHIFLLDRKLAMQLANGVGSTSHTNYGSQAMVADGQWHHVAITVDRDQADGIHWYLDGAEVLPRSNPLGRTGSLNNSQALFLGSRLDLTGFFRGELDEVELFHRVLAPEEIQAIFDAGSDGKCR